MENISFDSLLAHMMSLVEMLYNFCGEVFDTLFTQLKDFELFGTSLLHPPWDVWIGDYMLVEVMFGIGITFFIVYTLVKWVVNLF